MDLFWECVLGWPLLSSFFTNAQTISADKVPQLYQMISIKGLAHLPFLCKCHSFCLSITRELVNLQLWSYPFWVSAGPEQGPPHPPTTSPTPLSLLPIPKWFKIRHRRPGLDVWKGDLGQGSLVSQSFNSLICKVRIIRLALCLIPMMVWRTPYVCVRACVHTRAGML